jgi:hypothetical protein
MAAIDRILQNIPERPMTPPNKIRDLDSSPPKLKRVNVFNSKEELIRKYLHNKIEIENLKNENVQLLKKVDSLTVMISNHKQKMRNISDILFDNSNDIPENIYIKLMNSLL